MKTAAMEVTHRQEDAHDATRASWDRETMGWLAMLVAAAVVLAVGAWEVRQQNDRLIEQAVAASTAQGS